MQKLPNLSGAEVIKILKNFGFLPLRQKGSHVVLEKILFSEEIHCVVPLHTELKKGTLSGILRQAKIEKEDFLKHV